MGIIKHKDVLSSKYITAEITDSSNELHYVPIKYVLGDRFIAKIKDQLFCFKIEGPRIKTYKPKLAISCRVLHYDTNHYLPLSPADNKAIEDMIRENGLPKIDNKLLQVLKEVGRMQHETKGYTPEIKRRGRPKKFDPKAKKEPESEPIQTNAIPPFELSKLVELVAKQEKDYPEKAQNLKNYLERLDIKQIVTPVKKISEFIEGELKTKDPMFLGEIYSQIKRTETEQRRNANTPVTAKGGYLKLIIIMMLIVGAVGFGIWAMSSGALNNILPQIGGPTPLTPSTLMQTYPTPEKLKCALDAGKIQLKDLPAAAKSMLENYHPTTPVVCFDNSTATK